MGTMTVWHSDGTRCMSLDCERDHVLMPKGAPFPGSAAQREDAVLAEWVKEVESLDYSAYRTDREEQGYAEWIDLLESQVYVNAESRVHRDFSSQSGVQGFMGMQVQAPIAEEWDGEPEERGAYLRPEEQDVQECAGCEDAENAPHAEDHGKWYHEDGTEW